MAKIKRLMNMRAYASWSHLKAVFGLLSAEDRQRWCRYLVPPDLSRSTPDEVLPWIVFEAGDELVRHVRPDWKVLEFGCGFSTLWWAGRVSRITSIERRPGWADVVERRVVALGLGERLRLLRMPGLDRTVEAGWLKDFSGAEIEAMRRQYLSLAEPQPQSYDAVVVDDAWRVEVCLAAVEWIKPGGLLVLDNSAGYREVADELHARGFSSRLYSGSVPYAFVDSETTIFFKPQAAAPSPR